MATYNPKISITAAPGIAGYLYLVLYEASSPTVPVANSGQLAPPHASSRQIQFNGLNPVVHIGKLFETNGIATTGTVLANFSLDPQFPVVEIRPDLFLYGGTTAGFDVGEKSYIDPADSLEGWDYSLEIRTAGTIDPDIEYTKDANNNPVLEDDTDLAGGAGGVYQIYEGEIWVIHFFPKLITYDNAVNAVSPFITTEVITANRTLLAVDLLKNFIIESATTTIEVKLPKLADITVNRPLYLMSEGGSHKNVNVVCQDSDQIKYLGVRTKLILGQGENLVIYKHNGFFYVSNDLQGVKNVGKFFYAHTNDLANSAFCNGQELSRTIYSRLWDYINTELAPGMLVSDAVWNDASVTNSKGKFSLGDGSTTFRLPLLYDFIRGADGATRLEGTYQADALLSHSHRVNTTGNQVGVDPAQSLQRARTVGDGYGSVAGRPDAAVNPYIEAIGGSENLVRNTAMYICINT